MNDNIRELAYDLHASSVKRGKDWNGYKVFEPIYTKECYIGLPYVILVKDDKARICTDKECFEYMDFVANNLGKE